MRIHKVSIKEFKNLKGFNCIFSGSNTAAFIGNNGSGKSNLLEVITRAFSNAQNMACSKSLPLIYPGAKPDVQECVIEYSIADVNYTLQYNCGMEELPLATEPDSWPEIREKVEIWNGNKRLSKSELPNALPETVLIYYAGETQRQKGIAETTYDTFYETRLKRAKTSDLPGLRFIDCYNTGDLTLLLAAASAYRGNYYNELLTLLGCELIAPRFSLILRKPPKGKGTADTYWGATGFVKHFLDDLRKYVSSTRDTGIQYYMLFDNAEVLKKESMDELDLFAKLKALKYYGYLDHIGIEFIKQDGSHFSSLRLSEGEKQLTLLNLLTVFSAKKNVLYLFDEFDTYLHMNWQRQISKMLNDTHMNGHLIFTTHSPATISNIRSDELYVMKDGQVLYPETETFNRALDEIMLEQMGITMRAPHVEALYDAFKQSIADQDKDKANAIMAELMEILDENDPIFIKMRLVLRRI